ncbi:hypothetical protein KIW84_021936 [Lathyrus oleraceus]|uniref:Uncharacterized protein n=1 Tax=Pisum sativum TaxID=3888 RepID=A0A9D4Y968_PEA|nr:hypothetical protein KIW84_021936 [Pisum sativum]
MDINEVEILLVAHELRLNKFKKPSVPNLASLNLTHTIHSHLPRDEAPTASSDSSPSLMPTPNTGNDYQALRGSYGRGRGYRFSNDALQCLLQPSHTRSSPPLQAPLSTFIANTLPSISTSWFPNSGTSFHVTSEAKSIQQITPYEGPDQIYIRNGQGRVGHDGLYEFPSIALSPPTKSSTVSMSGFPFHNNVPSINSTCI